MQPRLMSVRQIAEVLGVAVQTIYGWVSQGRLPIVKVGRRTMFHPVEVERWIEMRSRKERDTLPAPVRMAGSSEKSSADDAQVRDAVNS